MPCQGLRELVPCKLYYDMSLVFVAGRSSGQHYITDGKSDSMWVADFMKEGQGEPLTQATCSICYVVAFACVRQAYST